MKSVKLTDNEIKRFNNITRSLHHEKPHQYESVRIKDGRIIFILYNSKKLVYNENSQTLTLLSKILEQKEYISHATHTNYQNNYNNSSISFNNYEFTIGSDETGKGEWYGPLVVSAVATSYDENLELKQIGVKDSKKLSRNEIKRLYSEIKNLNIIHETIVLKPFSYNKLYHKFTSEGKNLNHLLAYLHSKVITSLLAQIQTSDVLVIIDKFDYKKMNQYLDINKNIDVIQESNGERYIPVAASSIIAKYHYEKTLMELEERYHVNLSKKTKPKNIDRNILSNVAKTHFKNIKPYI
ncbi:ribonuclease HIII [Methanosphaera sp. WGK6]|uniref:ribonuclease HIII n=1 Tax=Methanosphaera sp. WGK6 TaxID=1561964 RepID=UPI00084C5F47|nr:ribonuclease HIII [Methanosphaera sp. WGK6]